MTFSQWEAQWPLDFGASLPRHSMGESGFDPRTWQRRGQRRGRSKKEVALPAKGPQAAPGKQRVLCCLLAVSTASRSLHMVFPKPGTLFPQTASCCALVLFRSARMSPPPPFFPVTLSPPSLFCYHHLAESIICSFSVSRVTS